MLVHNIPLVVYISESELKDMKAIQRKDLEDESIPVKNESTGKESYMEIKMPVRSEQPEELEDRAFYNTRLFLEDGTILLAMSADLEFIND